MIDQAPAELAEVHVRIDDEIGEVRLVIPVAHDQKRLGRKVALKPRKELRIVALAHGLPPQVLIELRHCVAGCAPASRREFRAEPIIPGKMIRREIDVEEQRSASVLAADLAQCDIEIEPVRLERSAAYVLAVDEILDTDAFVEGASAEKAAGHGIDRVGAIAAAAQSLRQAAPDPARGDACHEELETAIGSR